MRTRAFVIVVLALTLSACGKSSAPPQPKILATTAPGSVTVKVSGALQIDFRGTPQIQRVSSTGASVPAALRFLSVAVPQPQASGTVRFRAGFNLYGYEEKSSALIPAVQGTPSAGLRSIAYLDEVAPTARRFDRAVQACTLRLRKNAFAGEMVCPAIADAAGQTVSFRMTWDLTE